MSPPRTAVWGFFYFGQKNTADSAAGSLSMLSDYSGKILDI